MWSTDLHQVVRTACPCGYDGLDLTLSHQAEVWKRKLCDGWVLGQRTLRCISDGHQYIDIKCIRA